MFKKVISIVCIVALLTSTLITSSYAATVINEDVSVETPIYSGMETAAEAQAVDAQLTATASSASLCDDAEEGDFSLKVNVANEATDNYAQYTLVNSSAFSIASYSRVNLWVKPGAGSSWVSFYTNGALILSDKNKDGKFEVGSDLESGKWTRLTLDLSSTNPAITTGDNLVVRSDEYSVWYFDGIISETSQTKSVDLFKMVDSKTIMNNGKLEFKKTPNSTTYDTAPTILLSNSNSGPEKVLKTQADFAGGVCSNMTLNSDGGISSNSSNLCTSGTAISGGDSSHYVEGWFGGGSYYPLPASDAFDNSDSTYWQSLQSGSNLVGNAYIGYDFGISTQVDALYLKCSPCVTSADIQYYNSNTSQWVTVSTMGIPNTGYSGYYRFGSNISASKWRLLATGYDSSTSNQYFVVSDLKFYLSAWSYTSPAVDISSNEAIYQGIISLSTSGCTGAKIETQLSLDGGATWQVWAETSGSDIISGITSESNLKNARIKYRVSGIRPATESSVINAVSFKFSRVFAEPEYFTGRLEGIEIDSGMVDINGNSSTAADTTVLTGITPGVVPVLSGNGKSLFYYAAGNIYMVNLQTGVTSIIVTKTALGLTDLWNFKVNYDGSVLCALGTDDTNTNMYNLVRYIVPNGSSTTSGKLELVSTNSSGIAYDMQNNGTIAYCFQTSTSMYVTYYIQYCTISGAPTNIRTLQKDTSIGIGANGVAIAKASGDIFCVTPDGLSVYSAASMYSQSYGPFSGVTNIVGANSEGKDAIVFYNGSLCSCNVEAKVIHAVSSGIINMRALGNGKYLANDVNHNFYIYNPSANDKTNITPSDFNVANGYITADDSGSVLVYQTTSNYKVKYLANSQKVNKYLLSFDGKNTWYSYANGTWDKVSTAKTPDAACFDSCGMTTEKINALTKSDFDKLYADGSEVYSLDVAIYFNSISYEYTPSIKSILIVTDANSYDDAGASTANPLYAAKKTDFTGSKWRYVNKIYPVEVAATSADFIYFFYSNGKYMYYDGSAWKTESTNEISSLISDVKANWINLKLIGMTASELRSIPKSALTSQLAGKDFSVVYCMRVADRTTKGYLSMITADYTEDRYESNVLTLNINYSNGKTEAISGMTSTQIEDFMDWLLVRTKSSPNYFSFKVGSINYYINYYMISNVSVTEA